MEERRMRIGELIVLAGPSCIGKSHLIQQLKKGEPIAGLDIAPSIRCVEVPELLSLTGLHNKILLHYDLLEQIKNGVVNGMPDIVITADSITYITLVADSSVRKRRALKRFQLHLGHMVDGWIGKSAWRLTLRYLSVLHLHYTSKRLQHLYQEWYKFIANHPGTHWVADVSGDTSSDVKIQRA